MTELTTPKDAVVKAHGQKLIRKCEQSRETAWMSRKYEVSGDHRVLYLALIVDEPTED